MSDHLSSYQSGMTVMSLNEYINKNKSLIQFHLAMTKQSIGNKLSEPSIGEYGLFVSAIRLSTDYVHTWTSVRLKLWQRIKCVCEKYSFISSKQLTCVFWYAMILSTFF